MENKSNYFSVTLSDGYIYIQRKERSSSSEEPLTNREKALVKLHEENERLKLAIKFLKLGL